MLLRSWHLRPTSASIRHHGHHRFGRWRWRRTLLVSAVNLFAFQTVPAQTLRALPLPQRRVLDHNLAAALRVIARGEPFSLRHDLRHFHIRHDVGGVVINVFPEISLVDSSAAAQAARHHSHCNMRGHQLRETAITDFVRTSAQLNAPVILKEAINTNRQFELGNA